MLLQMVIAAGMMSFTTVLHASMMITAMTVIHASNGWMSRGNIMVREGVRFTALILWITLSQFIAMILWALLFLVLGDLHSFETSLYFAAVTATTLGYGDIVPAVNWRLLAAACGANGFILFGVSVALLFDHLMRFRALQMELRAAKPKLKSVAHGPLAGADPSKSEL